MPKTKSQSKRVKKSTGKSKTRLWQRLKPQYVAVIVVVVLVAAIGGFWTVNSSHAATGKPICMALHPSACLESNGPYNWETVGYTNHSNWTRISLGYSTYMFQNNAGNCLRVATVVSAGYKVEVGSQPCSATHNFDKWYLKGSPASYYNATYKCFLAVNDPGAFPKTAYCWNPAKGSDEHWTY